MHTPRLRSNGRQAAAFLAALVMAVAVVSAHDDDGVVQPGGRIAGKTIGQWTGEWWKAALETEDYPFEVGSGPGALGDVPGPVFFAVASPGPGSSTLWYRVPRHQYVLFPLFTYTWVSQSFADPCSDFACASNLADTFVNAVERLAVTIDGRPVHRLFRHFESTPRFFRANAPVDGWWAGGDPLFAGRWFGVASGYWLMLEPLSPGVHVITVAVDAPYASVCADGGDECAIPQPGEPEVSRTRLILTVR